MMAGEICAVSGLGLLCSTLERHLKHPAWCRSTACLAAHLNCLMGSEVLELISVKGAHWNLGTAHTVHGAGVTSKAIKKNNANLLNKLAAAASCVAIAVGLGLLIPGLQWV